MDEIKEGLAPLNKGLAPLNKGLAPLNKGLAPLIKQRKQRPKMSEEERKRRKNECEKRRYRRIVEATGKVVRERARTAEETKAWRTERVACECGCIIARGNLPVHRRSKKHQQLMFEISSRAES